MEIYTTEEQQVEAIKGWWQENGRSLIAGTLLGLALLFGWRYYNDYQQTAREQANADYGRLMTQLATEPEAALEAVAAFAAEHEGSAYGDLAALQLAAAAVEADKLALAQAQLQRVAERGELEEARAIASLRLARVLTAQGQFDAALTWLAGVQAVAYQAQVAEVRGDLYLQQGKPELARAAYQQAVAAAGQAVTPELTLKLDDLAMPATDLEEKPHA